MAFWPFAASAGRRALQAVHQGRAPAAAAAECVDDEAAVVRRITAGDRSAIDGLYRRHSGAVYRYALALCGNADWAADAVQEAFVGFAQRPEGFDPQRGPLEAYLIGAARHALWAQWRLQQQTVPLQADGDPSGDDPDEAAAPHHVNPEAVLVRAQTNDQVWQALRRLPWPQREAVVLVDVQERSYEEAAQIAGVELNTLRTRLHRGRGKLARWLTEAPASPRQPSTTFGESR